MPKKTQSGQGAATGPAQTRTDALSFRDSLTCSPAVSEQCSSPGGFEEGGASSASKSHSGRGNAPRVTAAARSRQSKRGRGTGAPLNTARRFKSAAESSPITDDDFSAISRGRATASRYDTGSRRALLSSIKESTASAGEKAPGGQTAVVGGGAATLAPAKRALMLTRVSATATQDAMAEEQTQDSAGQASAPALQFQVHCVRCLCACLRSWLTVCVRFCDPAR